MEIKKSWWMAAWKRAVRTVIQTLAGTLPVGLVVTSDMLKSDGINIILAIAAWLITGILSGVTSLFTSMVTTLPELEDVERGAHDE